MKPIGLRFKNDGELMIVHRCLCCGKISTNRIAGDDNCDTVISLLTEAPSRKNTGLLNQNDAQEVLHALFGAIIV
jgi:hypothetical protein